MKITKIAIAAAALAVICAGSAFAYYQSPQTASARNYQPGSAVCQPGTTITPAGPVTYHQGYRVMPDGSTQPVIAHHGYVVDQNGEMEMTSQPVYANQPYYCGSYSGCHR